MSMAEASPHTPLWELTALPQVPFVYFRGPILKLKGE